ncbi:MAG: ABC transporter permease [Calditrichia bacterium]|nr:ABC transporter permease [Calditrichia bacterium]
MYNGIIEAFRIIFSLNTEFIIIVLTSLKVSAASTIISSLIGIPLAIVISVKKFAGRDFIITVFNTLLSLPTVVVGLTIYSFLSRRGPMGELGLLFSPAAIIIGQVILIVPIITSLTISAINGLDGRILKTALALGANKTQSFKIFLLEARYGIVAAVVAGFGRVFAEVGVSMMLGGNIKGYTRTITTAIALETSKGEFALGIALGLVLLTVAFAINIFVHQFQKVAK